MSCRLFWVKSNKGPYFYQKLTLFTLTTKELFVRNFHRTPSILTSYNPFSKKSSKLLLSSLCEEQGPSVQHCGFTRLRKTDWTNLEKEERSTSGPSPFPSYPHAGWATAEKSQRCSSTSMIVLGMVNASYSIELLWRHCWEGTCRYS